jgi:hypothetical protein
MQSIISKYNQTFFDIAVIATGDASNAYQIAVLNNMSVTDIIPEGTELFFDFISNQSIVDYIQKSGFPATEYIEEQFRIFDETFDLTFE